MFDLMKNSTVSVVIPNYNHAHFLENAIRSYLRQTHQPLEIIVVDDGSTDNSIEVVEKMAQAVSHIYLIRLPRNLGVNKAIAEGLNRAQGDYVVFTAADDTVEKEFLEKSLNVLNENPQAGLSFSDPTELVYDNGQVIHYPLRLSHTPIYLSPEQLCQILRKYSFTFPSNSVLFNRELLIKSGGFLADLDFGADWMACFVSAFRYGVCYIPENLTVAMVRKDSLSGEGMRNAAIQRKIFFKVLDLLNTNFYDIKEKFKNSAIAYEYSWRALCWLLLSPRYRQYLSFLLIKRLMMRGTWHYLRKHTSPCHRKRLRKLILKYKITI